MLPVSDIGPERYRCLDDSCQTTLGNALFLLKWSFHLVLNFYCRFMSIIISVNFIWQGDPKRLGLTFEIFVLSTICHNLRLFPFWLDPVSVDLIRFWCAFLRLRHPKTFHDNFSKIFSFIRPVIYVSYNDLRLIPVNWLLIFGTVFRIANISILASEKYVVFLLSFSVSRYGGRNGQGLVPISTLAHVENAKRKSRIKFFTLTVEIIPDCRTKIESAIVQTEDCQPWALLIAIHSSVTRVVLHPLCLWCSNMFPLLASVMKIWNCLQWNSAEASKIKWHVTGALFSLMDHYQTVSKGTSGWKYLNFLILQKIRRK